MNKRFLSICLTVALIFSFCCITGCSNSESKKSVETISSDSLDSATNRADILKTIKKRGYIKIGCKTDVPGLGLYNDKTKKWSGEEIDLAYNVAGKIFGVSAEEAKSKKLVKLVGVTVGNREDYLRKNKIDLMIATYTITEERAEEFAISNSYYKDYIGLMVRDSGASEYSNSLGSDDIKSIADLDGKYIGVVKNSTTRDEIVNYLNTAGTTYGTSPKFCVYPTYEKLFKALKNEDIDCMSVDVSILKGYVDSSTTILKDRFAGQNYGAAATKENADLIDVVNEIIN